MDNLQPGQMLGVYRIISKVGQGGMATVYKAYQPSMDRNVAIKVLPGQLAESPEFAARFQQEARIIARLEHPHILPVFDYGEDNGVTYFVMRYLDAGSLKDKMGSGPLSLSEIDRVFTQLADALGYAHARGIVHRDLKPANALIDSDGNLFLTDFGIAKLLESASPRLTQTDAIMGTPAYISPEQAQAQPVDRRSDIYSLGIILYELVTGRVPFVADTPLAVILKHLSDPMPLPSILKPDIPDAIEKVILKALAKNPADRFGTTSEFVTAWKRALQDVETMHRGSDKLPPATVVSQPVSSPRQPQIQLASNTQTMSKSGRNTTGLAIGCIALLCLAAVVGGGFVFASGWLSQPTSTSIPPTQPPAATQTPLPSPTSAPPTEIPSENVFLEDDFTEENWGTLTDSDNSIEYRDDTLNMTIYAKNWFVWSTPNGETYEDVHMEVTALNNDTDVTTALGLMCHQQSDGDSFYYFAITPAGQYVIARATAGDEDFFLTNNNEWEFSDLIEEEDSYRIGADCGIDGTLTLYVNGEVIDSVTDTTYLSGGVGLITWSGEEATNTDVSFDDYLLTDLP